MHMPRDTGVGVSALIKRFWTPFLHDRRGATAVEFSLISVPFLGLLFAIFQTAYLFMTQQAIDAAAMNAGRNIMTGQTMTTGITDATSFKNAVICPGSSNTTGWSLPDYLSCSNLIVDVQPSGATGSSSSWSGGVNTSPTQMLAGNTKFCIGQSGDIVIVRLLYPVPAYLSIMTMSSSIASGGLGQSTAGQQSYTNSGVTQMVYPIMGISAFKNEPFPNATYTSPAGC